MLKGNLTMVFKHPIYDSFHTSLIIRLAKTSFELFFGLRNICKFNPIALLTFWADFTPLKS